MFRVLDPFRWFPVDFAVEIFLAVNYFGFGLDRISKTVKLLLDRDLSSLPKYSLVDVPFDFFVGYHRNILVVIGVVDTHQFILLKLSKWMFVVLK